MSRGSESAALDDRLDALAARVRRHRILRGTALTVLIAVLSAAGIGCLDLLMDLSAAWRTVLEVVWLLLVGASAARLAVRPWFADPPVEEVAERMMADESPNVVAALVREEREHRAYPLWPGPVLAVLALAVAFAGMMLAAKSGERVRRIALPWHHRAEIAPFDIIVVSEDTVARRGEPVTLSAYLRPVDANAALPATATLVVRGGESVPMDVRRGTLHATLPAPDADFEYRIEAAGRSSAWHAVRLADPVELASGTTIAVTPPQYAAPYVKPAVIDFNDLDVLQFSTAALLLKFTRAAESASIEWRPQGRNPFEAADPIPVALAADRRSGTATVALRANGTLTVLLVNESGPRRLRTESAIAVRVQPDSPPRFERIDGLAVQPRSLRPGLPLQIGFVARAGFGPPSAVVEYATNGGGGIVPVLIEPLGPDRIEGRASVDVPRLAKNGETIRLRVKIRDSRRVPDQELGPQGAAFPPSGWFEVRIAASAPPFDEQQITAERDAVAAVLDGAKEKLQGAKSVVEELGRENVQPLPLDQQLKTTAVREQIRDVRMAMEKAADECRLSAPLAAAADRLVKLADGDVREADDRLQQAEDGSLDVRARFLKLALTSLASSLEEANRLAAWNTRFAQGRLDRSRLQSLLQDQKALEKLTGEALADRQRKVLAELKRIVAASESLTQGTARAAANESALLAAESRRLANRIRDLDAAVAGLNASLRKELLVELAELQTELAKQVVDVAKRMDAAARLANLPKPKPGEFDSLAKLLERDKVVDALTEAERLALGLEKLAEDCEAWAADRADARLAAGQFAKWQADLRARRLADPKLDALQEQRAILNAVERMRVPADAAPTKDAALVHLRLAVRRLDAAAAEPEVPMKFAAEALDRLAAKLPALADRLLRARNDLKKIKDEQDEQIGQVEKALRTFEKLNPTPAVMQNIAVNLNSVHTRQLKLMDRMAALDLPTHESRQSTIVAAMRGAAADLKDGLPSDCIASLGAVRRELDRLKQALEGHIPADVRSRELATKQAESLRLVLAAEVGSDVKAWEPVIVLQREIAAGLASPGFAAPEAPGLLLDAQRAAVLAEASLGDSKHDAIVRRLRDSKEALELLADRLSDRETERDRVKRFIAMRRTAECQAKKLAGRPMNAMASAAAKAELDAEFSELAMTRVGAAAQSAKRKLFDLYLRLQSRPEPDRQAADQRQLADALAEVAGLMTNEARLTTRPEVEFPPSDPTDDYLPSKKHAAALREAARQQRELRERVNGVAALVTDRMKPATTNPFAAVEEELRSVPLSADGSIWQRGQSLTRAAALERLAVGDGLPGLQATSNEVAAQQVRRHAALAAQARELALRFALAEGVPVAPEAVEWLRSAEQDLLEAGRKSGNDATQLRVQAHRNVRMLVPAKAAGPVEAVPPAAVALQDAERAMARAVRELGPQGDAQAAADAVRRAIQDLQRTLAAIPPH